MAAGNARNALSLQAGRTRRVRVRHYPCCAGGSATRHMLRLRRQALRLRCAPSSWARNVEERGAQRSASRLRTPSHPVSCGITSGDGGIERAPSLKPAGWAQTAGASPPLPLLRREIVPHGTCFDSDAERSDFAALRRRGRFTRFSGTRASRRSGGRRMPRPSTKACRRSGGRSNHHRSYIGFSPTVSSYTWSSLVLSKINSWRDSPVTS